MYFQRKISAGSGHQFYQISIAANSIICGFCGDQQYACSRCYGLMNLLNFVTFNISC